MSAVALHTAGRGAWQGFANGCRQFLLGMAEGPAAARRYRKLTRLSDAELKRVDVTRQDVAWFAVSGKPLQLTALGRAPL